GHEADAHVDGGAGLRLPGGALDLQEEPPVSVVEDAGDLHVLAGMENDGLVRVVVVPALAVDVGGRLPAGLRLMDVRDDAEGLALIRRAQAVEEVPDDGRRARKSGGRDDERAEDLSGHGPYHRDGAPSSQGEPLGT